MSLSTALNNLASALDNTLFELTPTNETQQTYSWMTDEELLRHLSTDDTPLIIELRERLERAFEERDEAEEIAENRYSLVQHLKEIHVTLFDQVADVRLTLENVTGHFKKAEKEQAIEQLIVIQSRLEDGE